MIYIYKNKKYKYVHLAPSFLEETGLSGQINNKMSEKIPNLLYLDLDEYNEIDELEEDEEREIAETAGIEEGEEEELEYDEEEY